jgi:hypothetical protein
MDVRINEVQSRVQVGDSQSLLDPRVMRELVRACVKAVKEELERDKRLENERRLRSGGSSGTRSEE